MEMNSLKEISDTEAQVNSLSTELREVKAHGDALLTEISNLQGSCQKLHESIEEIESAFKTKTNTIRAQYQTKFEGLIATIAEKEKDLKSKDGTIAKLMSEVGTAGEAAAKLEASLQKMKKESEREREIAMDRGGKQAQQIKQLQKKIALAKTMEMEMNRLKSKIADTEAQVNTLSSELKTQSDTLLTELTNLQNISHKQQACIAEIKSATKAKTKQNVAKIEELRATIAAKGNQLGSKAGTIAQLLTSEVGSSAEVAVLEAKSNEAKIEELTAIIAEKEKELDSKAGTIARLSCEISSAAEKLETTLKQNQTKVEELTATIAEKEKELNSQADIIAQLMREFSIAAAAAAKSEASLQKMRKESEREREIARDRDGKQAQQIEKLQKKIAEKEKELLKQMTVILEMRNPKKELTGQPRARSAGDAPDLDDKAVAFVPIPSTQPPRDIARPQNIMKSPGPRKQAVNNRSDSPTVDMLFNFFSDDSMDNDPYRIEQRQVGRRFEELSRKKSQPAGSSTSKRRKVPSAGLVTKGEDKELTGQPRARSAGDAPDLDDKAVAFVPIPSTQPPRDIARPQNTMKSPGPSKQAVNNRSDTPNVNRVFNFSSDDSMDNDSYRIEQRQVGRRFEELSRKKSQPAGSSTSKRRKVPSAGLVTKGEDDLTSVSQIKKNEPRKFFKSSRPRLLY